jgi:methylphosphotriester-DNA--protein-cysteine methyltransferase
MQMGIDQAAGTIVDLMSRMSALDRQIHTLQKAFKKDFGITLLEYIQQGLAANE